MGGEFSVVWPWAALHGWVWQQSPDMILFLGACLGVGSFVALTETVAAFRTTRAMK